MAVDFTEDYEGAADETTISGANSQYDVIVGTPVFDTAQAMEGTRSGRYASAGAITSTGRTFTARSLVFDRIYLFVTGAPAANQFIAGCNSGATIRVQNRIHTDLTIGVRNGTTLEYTFTTVLSTSTWYRMERHIDLSAGQQETRLFLGHASSALETSGVVAAPSGVTGDRVAYGNLTAVTGTTIWMDDATSNNGAGGDSWPGPSVVVSSVMPRPPVVAPSRAAHQSATW